MKGLAVRRIHLFSLMVCVGTLAGCGKSFDTSLASAPGSLACGDSGRTLTWEFTQPNGTPATSIDMLFVIDTSSSLRARRAQVAKEISALVGAFPVGADYRIAVMLGHGGASRYAGRLWAASGSQAVLSSASFSLAEISRQLGNSLANVRADADEANGEALLYSFARSLAPDRLAEIRAQGFYRSTAALAVTFITDENDVCFDPVAHGYTDRADSAPDPGDESIANARYCQGTASVAPITPESVAGLLATFKPGNQFSVGGIIHVNPAQVPTVSGEEAIGHGVLELVHAAPHGLAIEVADSSYHEGLRLLGDLSAGLLALQTVFPLGGLTSAQRVDRSSFGVQVDGKTVPFALDGSAASFTLAFEQAGHAASRIRAQACVR